jgi:hypothetical protein
MRWLRGFFVGGVLGTIFGLALGFFLFPYVFPPPEAMETLNKAQARPLVAKGTFIHPIPTTRSTTATAT